MKPPRGTTHLRLDTNGKRAVELIKDKDCMVGCEGKITYLRKQGKSYKELGSFEFDGSLDSFSQLDSAN